MSVMQLIFGKQSPAEQQAATTPANPPTALPPGAGATQPDTSNTAGNGVLPPGTTEAATTPLDQYADLWKDKPTDPNAPPVDPSIFGKVNSQELIDVASKMDFTKLVTPELLAKAKEGGEEGVKALLAVMNSVSQYTYAQNANATTLLIEQAIAKHTEKLTAQLPAALRQHATDDLIKGDPVLGHAASKPIIDGIMQKLASSHPNDTPAQLKERAEGYLIAFSQQVLNRNNSGNDPQKSREEVDWEAYFNADNNINQQF